MEANRSASECAVTPMRAAARQQISKGSRAHRTRGTNIVSGGGMQVRKLMTFAVAAGLLVARAAVGVELGLAAADDSATKAASGGTSLADELQEVVVTAQRRATGVLETPISI